MRYLSTVVAIALTALSTAAFAIERGYAIWNAESPVPAGTIVRVRDGKFVEWAFLRPVAAVRTLNDLIDEDRQKVILPVGGLLAQMSGKRQGEYCTWNHGKKILRDRSRVSLTSVGGLLCVAITTDHQTTALHYISGTHAMLLREDRFDFARGAQKVNSVKVEDIDPKEYYKDVETGPVLSFGRGNPSSPPCLKWAMAVNGSQPEVFSYEKACFSDNNRTLNISGATYTLISSENREASIQIDQPFRINDIIPRIIR